MKRKPFPGEIYTQRWVEAGRMPTEGRSDFYSDCVWDGHSFGDWLHSRFIETCRRKEYWEKDPKPQSIPHYSIQKGMPRAFTYAVGLGNGIKVGKTGTGDGDLLKQVRSRFGLYKSTHTVEVIGIDDHPLHVIDKAESELLQALADYKLDTGQEFFQDCPNARQIIWEQFQCAWHQPKELPKRQQRLAYWEATSHSPFHCLKGKTHHFAFDWPDYIRLVEEIDLLSLVSVDFEEFEDIFNENRKERGMQTFCEQDDPFPEALSLYLPESESLYPKARKRLKSLLHC